MAGNTFGKILQLTSFGESHGKAIGGVLEGFPAGLTVDIDFIQRELNRRRPGQSQWVSPRNESDKLEILSGVFEGMSLGTPIGFVIWNKDQHSHDYSHIKDVYRPSHADYTYEKKYGIRDYRGGGRSSARETVARVAAGAFAKILLKKFDIQILAYVKQMGDIFLDIDNINITAEKIENSPLRCPDKTTTEKMIHLIEKTASEGNTLGGQISCIIKGVPAGLGEPVFDKLHADLGKAMLGINAVKGFEIGSGFSASRMKGSEHNDIMENKNGNITTRTNYSGGIQGGISNGNEIYFNVAFKPIATIMQTQETINSKGEKVNIEGKGRHDVTVLPRAVPIVEAMAALVIADHLLRNNIARID